MSAQKVPRGSRVPSQQSVVDLPMLFHERAVLLLCLAAGMHGAEHRMLPPSSAGPLRMPAAAPAPAAPAPTYGQAPATGAVKTTSQCDAEYAANKAAIKASGQTKRIRRCLPRRQRNDPTGNRGCPATNLQSTGRCSLSARPSADYGFTVPVVAARRSSRSARAGSSPNNVQPSASGHRRRRVHVRPTSAGSLPVRHRRLSQYAIAHLSLRWNPQLRHNEERGLHVRGGCEGGRRPRGGERTPSIALSAIGLLSSKREGRPFAATPPASLADGKAVPLLPSPGGGGVGTGGLVSSGRLPRTSAPQLRGPTLSAMRRSPA